MKKIELHPSLFINYCSQCGVVFHYEHEKRDFICTYCKLYDREFHKLSKKLRDGGKCAVCGDEKRLVVHHKDKNKKNNDPKNLLVLCVQCHASIHGHNLRMPVEVKRGLFGKRLIYKEVK